MCVLHVAGITMYAVGVGKAVEDELREIASEPMEKHFFYSADFTAISQIAENLKLNVCAGVFERLRTHTIPESPVFDHTQQRHLEPELNTHAMFTWGGATECTGRHCRRGVGGVGCLGAPLPFFKIIHKCPSGTNSNDIVVNKTKCIWILIYKTICTKQYSSKVGKFLFILLAIWAYCSFSECIWVNGRKKINQTI